MCPETTEKYLGGVEYHTKNLTNNLEIIRIVYSLSLFFFFPLAQLIKGNGYEDRQTFNLTFLFFL